MAATVVPYENPDQSTFNTALTSNPLLSIWWTTQTVSGVPENVMGWLVAQGWQITGVTNDTSTNPPTRTYALTTQQLDSYQALVGLCNSYKIAADEAKAATELRYNEVVEDWQEAIASSQTHFDNQVTAQNADLGVYISDIDSYMDAIDTLIDENRNDLGTDYELHKTTTRALLTDLGSTEVARINELFAATLSVQLQQLTDRGLYSAGVAADITARNQRDRDEQLQKHYDSLNREKLVNEHRLYDQRGQLSQQKNQAIAQRLNTAAARIEGWRHVAAENQRLMAYQLDTRNNLLIGLYSFVERRTDIGPEWRDMTQMVASLADSAGGWITP